MNGVSYLIYNVSHLEIPDVQQTLGRYMLINALLNLNKSRISWAMQAHLTNVGTVFLYVDTLKLNMLCSLNPQGVDQPTWVPMTPYPTPWDLAPTWAEDWGITLPPNLP